MSDQPGSHEMSAGGYVLPYRFEGPEHAPYPGYVQTPEQRERWDLCAGIVSTMSAWYEPSGHPDPRFVWVGTRALYASDTPTGEPTPETTAVLGELRKQRPPRGSTPLDPTM